MDTNVAAERNSSTVQGLYDKLEDRCLMRDQKGASDVYYDLVRAGRPLKEIIAEGVRIHAPYTHVPYHERIDDGYPNFVNNDHCLLSARATLNLNRMLPQHLSMLPMAVCAACETIISLTIEMSFIATFTHRYFGK